MGLKINDFLVKYETLSLFFIVFLYLFLTAPQINLPDETESSIKKTIAWARKLNPETAQFLAINIYPGTELHKTLSRAGWIRDGEPDYPHLPKEKLHF